MSTATESTDPSSLPSSSFPPLSYGPHRFREAQVHRTVHHPTLPQPVNGSLRDLEDHPNDAAAAPIDSTEHCFVVAADTQFGMTEENEGWATEMDYSRRAVAAINALHPRPLFCCICGDLVDMTAQIFAHRLKNNTKKNEKSTPPTASATEPPTTATTTTNNYWTVSECDRVQQEQFADMQSIWSNLHPSIALVCLCGNHDVGNRPTAQTIDTFTRRFGDDYLSFWANGTYHVVLNSTLFSDPTDAMDLYQIQLDWLEDRLRYAHANQARAIFVYSHHPWFLYDENEGIDVDNDNDDNDDDTNGTVNDTSPETLVPASKRNKSSSTTTSRSRSSYQLTGQSLLPHNRSVPDSYFPIPKQYRRVALELFRNYQVTAAFAGHFHQNVVSQTSFGMAMIVTGSLSVVLESSGNTSNDEPKTQGFRIVHVTHNNNNEPLALSSSTGSINEKSSFQHRFVGL